MIAVKHGRWLRGVDGAMNTAASRLGFAAGIGGADGVAAAGSGAGAGAGAGRRRPRPRHGIIFQILGFLPRARRGFTLTTARVASFDNTVVSNN